MGSVASVMWDAELAAVYDDVYAWEAEPSVVEPITGVLAELAGSGAALDVPAGAREQGRIERSCGTALVLVQLPCPLHGCAGYLSWLSMGAAVSSVGLCLILVSGRFGLCLARRPGAIAARR